MEDSQDRIDSSKPPHKPASSLNTDSNRQSEQDARRGNFLSGKHQRTESSGANSRERRRDMVDGRRRQSPTPTSRLPTDTFSTKRGESPPPKKQCHHSSPPIRTREPDEQHKGKQPSREPSQRSGDNKRSSRDDGDRKPKSNDPRHLSSRERSETQLSRKQSLDRNREQEKRKDVPLKVDRSSPASLREKSPLIEEKMKSAKIVDESETLSSDETESDTEGSEVSKEGGKVEEPPFYGPTKPNEDDEDSADELPEVGPIDEVNGNMDIEPKRSLYDDLPPYFPGLDGKFLEEEALTVFSKIIETCIITSYSTRVI